MPTATRTVVFTDLANYTASVSRANREALRDLLRTHETLVIPTLSRHNGRIVKNLGDSFMALFASATDAVRAGLDLVARAREEGLSIRVSAATGDVEEINDDAFGDAVNLASRINGRTPAEEVRFSEGTFQCMNQSEIPWDRVGLVALKGIPGEVPVYRAVPHYRAWLPEPVAQAVRQGTLVTLDRGEPVPPIPPESIVLLRGFPPGSEALAEAVDALPVLEPSRIWLLAYHVAPGDRYTWQEEGGRGLVIGTPEALELAMEEQRRIVTRDPGSDTIILDASLNAVLEIAIAGLALPRVPMADVVGGYTYDLVDGGRWVNRSEQALLRIEAGSTGVVLVAMTPGLSVDGRPLAVQERLALREGMTLTSEDRQHVFHEQPEGAYMGFLLSSTPYRILVGEGQQAELGREPGHPGLALPDRRGQGNIRWCGGSRAARARESGFTLDRALVGRRQAAIVCHDGLCEVEALHERCPTWLWRADGGLERVNGRQGAKMGEFVVAGSTVVSLSPPRP